MSGRVRAYFVGAVIATVAVAWVYANFFPGAGLADLRGLLPDGGNEEEAGAPAPETPGLRPETAAEAAPPKVGRTRSSSAPQEETTAAEKEPASPEEAQRTMAPEATNQEAGPSASDRERASATAANFVLTVWGYDGADVEEYWSRVQPLVTVGFYDSPGGAEVEAGAGVAEAGGPSVAPAFLAETFGGFEVTEQGPDRVEGVASFVSEEYPAGQRVSQEQDLALVRAKSGDWLIDWGSELRTKPSKEEA